MAHLNSRSRLYYSALAFISLAVSLFALNEKPAYGEYESVRVFFVIEELKVSKLDFALDFSENLFKRKQVKDKNPEVRLIFVGRAFSFLVDDKAPIKSRYKKLRNNGWNINMVGCGKAVKKMNSYLKAGSLKLLPAVKLVKSCGKQREEMVKDNWIRVRIPDEI